MSPILQAANQVVQTAVQLHVVEGAGFITLLSAAWHLVRRFHAGEVKVSDTLGEIHTKMAVLDTTVRGHIKHAPTLTHCGQQAAKIESTIHRATEKARDDMLAVSLTRDAEVGDLEKRVRKTEKWQAKRNGMESGT